MGVGGLFCKNFSLGGGVLINGNGWHLFQKFGVIPLPPPTIRFGRVGLDLGKEVSHTITIILWKSDNAVATVIVFRKLIMLFVRDLYILDFQDF